MKIGKTATLILSLLLLCISAGAQTSIPLKQQREKFTGRIGGASGLSGAGAFKLSDPVNFNDKSIPEGYGKYDDATLGNLAKTMEERDWTSEDTAWKRASALNNSNSYQRYIALFPHGAHIAEANTRLIDIKVTEALNDAHDELPNLKRVVEDDESPTSTLVIKNNTNYPLTVMFSGADTKSIVIVVDGTAVVNVTNGAYKIAASVPPSNIRPFAGKTEFSGGRYETGFWVVRQ